MPTQSSRPEEFPANLAALNLKDELTTVSFQPYLGRDFASVLANLKTQMRHAIAHLSQFEGALDADTYDDVMKCLKAVPVLRYIARKMLDNYLSSSPP